jgi:hypothetical protein
MSAVSNEAARVPQNESFAQDAPFPIALSFLEHDEVIDLAERLPSVGLNISQEKITSAMTMRAHANAFELMQVCQLTGNMPTMGGMGMLAEMSACYRRAMPHLQVLDFNSFNTMMGPGADMSQVMVLAMHPDTISIVLDSAHTISLETLQRMARGPSAEEDGVMFNMTISGPAANPQVMARLLQNHGIHNENELRVAIVKKIIQHADSEKLGVLLNLIRKDRIQVQHVPSRIEVYKAAALRMQENGATIQDLTTFANACRQDGLTFAEIVSIVTPALQRGNPMLALVQNADGTIVARIHDSWSLSDI